MSFTSKLEKSLLPLAEVIANNRYITILKNAFIAIMPFLIVGSFLLLLTNFPVPGYVEFVGKYLGEGFLDKLNYGITVTYGIMSLLVIIIMSQELSEHLELGKSAYVMPVVMYLLMFDTDIFDASGNLVSVSLPLSSLGAQSMFLGILITIVTLHLMHYFSSKKMFSLSMPDSVPPEIINSFKSLFPIGAVLLIGIAIKSLFLYTSFHTLDEFINVILQQPLMLLGGNIIAQVLTEILTTFFWFFGLHGSSIVGSIMGPVWTSLSAENLVATQAGLMPVNIITQQFRDVFLVSGGTGFTLALLISIFIISKSQRLNKIAKIAGPAAIFNINEPIIFGIPIVLNPIMLIPFVVTPAVLCITTYIAMRTGMVPPTSGVVIPWTTPIFISGFLTTGINGMILQAVNLVIGVLIYLPFVKVLDKQYLEEEKQEEAAKNESVEATLTTEEKVA